MPAETIELLTASEAAKRLRMSEKTLREHVENGEIAWIPKGTGLKRPRRLFHPDDLNRFAESRRRFTLCQSTDRGTKRESTPPPIITTTSGVVVHGFMARLAAERREKLENTSGRARKKQRP